MGRKSQVILIGGSPGLNSKHVLLSPECQDLTERAKDNLNNVGWAGEISIHCCSRGNGVLRMRGILTRLPAGSSLLFLIRNLILSASFSSVLGLERVWGEHTGTGGERFCVRGPLSLMGRKIGEWKEKIQKERGRLKSQKNFSENRLNEKEIKWPWVTRKHQIGGRGGLQWKGKRHSSRS